jgi:Uma2 family endonuclease
MIPDLYIPTYTINDWKLWEGDWELIKGSPVAMSPSPLSKHQLMGSDLVIYLGNALKKNKATCNCRIVYEEDWIIDESTVVRPDIMIICGSIEPNNHIIVTPSLIVEIFSKSTLLKDRNTKFNLYEFCGVKYYLMVDPDSNSVEVFELIDNKYKQIFAPFSFTINETCVIDFDLKQALEG